MASQDGFDRNVVPVHPQKVVTCPGLVSCQWPEQATPYPDSPKWCFAAAREKLPLRKGERILVRTCGPRHCRERFLDFMVGEVTPEACGDLGG